MMVLERVIELMDAVFPPGFEENHRNPHTPDSMPAVKKKTTAMTDIVAFNKHTAALAKATEALPKALETLETWKDDTLSVWRTKIEASVKEHDEQVEHMEQDRKRRRVDHEIEIKEHGFKFATNLLEGEGYSSIKTDALAELRGQVEDLTIRLETAEADTTARVTTDLKKTHEFELKEQNLSNAAEVAALKAKNEMLVQQVVNERQTNVESMVKQLQAILMKKESTPRVVQQAAPKRET
jgi:hypothetical protein